MLQVHRRNCTFGELYLDELVRMVQVHRQDRMYDTSGQKQAHLHELNRTRLVNPLLHMYLGKSSDEGKKKPNEQLCKPETNPSPKNTQIGNYCASAGFTNAARFAKE